MNDVKFTSHRITGGSLMTSVSCRDSDVFQDLLSDEFSIDSHWLCKEVVDDPVHSLSPGSHSQDLT